MKKLLLLSMMVVSASSFATLTVYTNRAAWTTAVGSTHTHAFEDWFAPQWAYLGGPVVDGDLTVNQNAGPTNFWIDSTFGYSDPTDLISSQYGDNNFTFTNANPMYAFAADFEVWDTAGVTITFDFNNGDSYSIAPGGGYGYWDFLGFTSDSTFTMATISAPGSFVLNIDDVAHDAVPEPASVLALGLGAAFFARRRR